MLNLNSINYKLSKNISVGMYYLQGHGLDDGQPFQSDFGTDITVHDSVNVYMVQRSAIFFQAVVNGIASNLTTTRFTECENKRIGCSPKNNNNGCKQVFHNLGIPTNLLNLFGTGKRLMPNKVSLIEV